MWVCVPAEVNLEHKRINLCKTFSTRLVQALWGVPPWSYMLISSITSASELMSAFSSNSEKPGQPNNLRDYLVKANHISRKLSRAGGAVFNRKYLGRVTNPSACFCFCVTVCKEKENSHHIEFSSLTQSLIFVELTKRLSDSCIYSLPEMWLHFHFSSHELMKPYFFFFLLCLLCPAKPCIILMLRVLAGIKIPFGNRGLRERLCR